MCVCLSHSTTSGDDPLPCSSLGGPYSVRLLRYEVPGEASKPPEETLVYTIPKETFKENGHSLVVGNFDEPYVPDAGEVLEDEEKELKKADKPTST